MTTDKIMDDHALGMYQPGIKGATNHGNTKAIPFPLQVARWHLFINLFTQRQKLKVLR